jgi:hypothetical protein
LLVHRRRTNDVTEKQEHRGDEKGAIAANVPWIGIDLKLQSYGPYSPRPIAGRMTTTNVTKSDIVHQVSSSLFVKGLSEGK